MRGTTASGRCQAKTGTLIGVSNLAGYCQSKSGDILAFAFFTDGIATERAHTIQDAMAIALARYCRSTHSHPARARRSSEYRGHQHCSRSGLLEL